jgi:hypothetical protein
MSTYVVKMTSLNGAQEYEIETEAASESEARKIAGAVIADYVAETYGRTPSGLPYLGDTRTTVATTSLS